MSLFSIFITIIVLNLFFNLLLIRVISLLHIDIIKQTEIMYMKGVFFIDLECFTQYSAQSKKRLTKNKPSKTGGDYTYFALLKFRTHHSLIRNKNF